MENEWLKKVNKYHQEWIAIVKNLGGQNVSEDIVQEAYIKLVKYNCKDKVIINGKVSRGYMFFVLRSIFLTYLKKTKGIYKTQIESYLFESDEINEIKNIDKFVTHNEIEKEEAFGDLCNRMDAELETWHWYDKRIFEIYRDTTLSIRGMAKETKISWVSIYHTLKKGKQKMKEKFANDYTEFKNGNYNKLN